MKFINSLFSSLLMLVLISCGPKVSTVKPMDRDLSKYDTFAYLPNTNEEVPERSYNDEEVNTFILESINKNLREEGYQLDREDPDLLVLVSTKIDTELAVDTDPIYTTYPYTAGIGTIPPYYEPYYYPGYNNYVNIVGYDTDTYAYEEGTLIVQLVDSDTKNTVWKGVATDPIFEENSLTAIQDMVDDIFEEYPLNN